MNNPIVRSNKLVSQELTHLVVPSISSSVAKALLLSADSLLATIIAERSLP